MRTLFTRRSAVLGLGAVASFGLMKGCGGGGGGEEPQPPAAGGSSGGGGSGSTTLPGAFWYSRSGILYKVVGGVADPVEVNRSPENSSGYWSFAVARNGPRYLQVGNFGVGSPSNAVINCFDHATNQAYCYVNVPGYVAHAQMSPSGRYIGVLRSSELAYASYNASVPDYCVVEFMIVDVSDVNNIRVVRSDLRKGAAAVYSFQWFGDDNFVYMTWGGAINGDAMVSGTVAGGTQGDKRLGAIDKQGMKGVNSYKHDRLAGTTFEVHPEGTSMLLSLFSDDGSLALGTWDVYLYDTSGRPIDRMTGTGVGYQPLWSPDGKYFFFQNGYRACGDPGCGPSCSVHYATADKRMATPETVNTLDRTKLNCDYGFYWSANA